MDTDTVTYFSQAPELLRGRRAIGEIQLVCQKAGTEKVIIGTDDDPVLSRMKRDDIKRRPCRDSQTFPLADGIKGKSLMPSENTPLCVYNISRAERFRRMILQKFGIRFFTGQETDILRFCFVISRESFFFRYTAGIFFIHAAEGEKDMGKLVLGQVVHHVGLVFGDIRGLFYLVLSAGTVISDSRIMSRGEVRTIKVSTDGVIKKTELNFKIAHHTGIRRDAVFVRIHKIGQHYVLIHFPYINDLVGDTEEVSHFLRLC